MFERFSDEARAVVVRAQDVARSTGDHRVEPVHLLLAVAVGGGRGATALRAALRAEAALCHRRLDDGSVLLGVLQVRDAAVTAVLTDQRVDPLAVRAGLAPGRAA